MAFNVAFTSIKTKKTAFAQSCIYCIRHLSGDIFFTVNNQINIVGVLLTLFP
jgi:hypothetical protein